MPLSPYVHEITHARCNICRRTEAELKGAKMKRCSGCAMVVYCSKECQKEGWPRHKIACRAQWVKQDATTTKISTNTTVPHSETVAAVTAALDAWKGTHSYGLMTIATTTVYLSGGLDLHFSTPRVLVLRLQRLSKERYNLTEGNPAEGFHIASAESMSREALLEASGDQDWVDRWELWQSQCRDLEAMFPGRTGPTSPLAGSLPAVFEVQDSPVLVVSPLPVRRSPLVGDAATDPESRAILEDVKVVTVRTIGFGLVLQAPLLPLGRLPPQVGQMAQKKKRDWMWCPIPQFWNWITTSEAEIMSPGDLKAGLDMTLLWARLLYGNPPGRADRSNAGTGR